MDSITMIWIKNDGSQFIDLSYFINNCYRYKAYVFVAIFASILMFR